MYILFIYIYITLVVINYKSISSKCPKKTAVKYGNNTSSKKIPSRGLSSPPNRDDPGNPLFTSKILISLDDLTVCNGTWMNMAHLSIYDLPVYQTWLFSIAMLNCPLNYRFPILFTQY